MKQTNNYPSTILALSSLLLSIHVMLFTSINKISLGDLGIIYRMPITFWIGLFLIFPLLYLGKDSDLTIIAGLILIIIYLYLIPAVVRNPVWLSNSFYPFGEGVIISQQGHLVKSSNKIITSYQDWPIFLYLSAILLLIPGFPQEFILKFFPVFFISFYITLLYLILRQKFNIYNSIMGCIWFLSSFWVRQHYFGPPGLSYVYFSLILLVVLKLYLIKEDNILDIGVKRSYSFLAILLYLTLTATHLLTSFFALLFISSLYIVDRYYRKTVDTNIKSLIMTFGVILVSYNTLAVQGVLLKIIFRELFLVEQFRIYQESGRIIGSLDMVLGYYSSWVIVLLNGIVAMYSLYRIRQEKKLTALDLFNVIFLFLIGGFAIVGRYGSNEAYQRAFMFGLIPLSYLSINALKEKRAILVILISFIVLTNIPAQYGSDMFRFATSSQLDGSEFFSEAVPEETKVLTKFTLYFRYFTPEKKVTIVGYGDFPFTSNTISSEIDKALNDSDYYVVSNLLENFYLYYLGENPLKDVQTSHYDRVYDNPDYKIFKTNPKI